jgi:predicted PurR-regulated permease PerM
MPELSAATQKLRKTILVTLALGISLLFLRMISDFLMALVLAAIASNIFHPVYRFLLVRLKERRALSSFATVALVFLLVIGPAIALLAIVAAQAIEWGQVVGPWAREQMAHPTGIEKLLDSSPALAPMKPYQAEITSRAGEVAGHVGSHVVAFAATAAEGTATFLLLLFVMLYAMFFFLLDGRALLTKILYYLPLTSEDENLMIARFTSVSLAAIKGTLVIGAIQGALGGIAFAVAGIDGAALWGTLMALLSALPGVGAALVWIPAVVYLSLTDRYLAALLLFSWCAVVVGLIDNFLRPRLVGRSAQMPDLLILISTLGGIALFGPIGFIVGPVIAALFVTVWDLYGQAFSDVLPEVKV